MASMKVDHLRDQQGDKNCLWQRGVVKVSAVEGEVAQLKADAATRYQGDEQVSIEVACF